MANRHGHFFWILTATVLSCVTREAFPQNPQQDAAYSAMWRAVLDFENPTNGRPQLLAEIEAVVTNYPGSKYEQRAKDTAAILRRMIAEDAAHAKNTTTNLDRLLVENRVRELIFQLRDQNGHQWSQPGSCDIFLDRRGTNSPASQLVSIGYPAVPQLINALDDDTFSRSIGYHRNFYFSHTVLTVGDCAIAILQRIAGRSFYRPASTSGYMSNENKNAATRKAVEAWWSDFQTRGEEQMLVEGTEAGDGSSPVQAELLIESHPQKAMAALFMGIQNATDDWPKTRLVQLLEKFDLPESLAFLEQEMKKGASAPSVAAAAILNHKGRHEAVTFMIHEWGKSPNTGPSSMKGPNELVRFLASVDFPDAINSLGKNLQDCALNTRVAVVETVGEGGSWWYGRNAMTNRSAATCEAVEKLLVTALSDEGQEMGESGSRMGKSYIDPRVCDMAAFFLNQLWPQRYDFDLAANIMVRDNQRINCQNIWRREHQIPLLPLPLPPTNHVARTEAAKVTAVEWKAGTVKPSDAFAARVEDLKNKILPATNVADLLVAYATNPEPGTSGITFQARKDDDLTGVKIAICLLPGTPPNSKDDWRFAEDGIVGSSAIDCRAGGIFATEKRSWNDLMQTFGAAVAAAPETPFVINVKLASQD